MKDEQRFTDDLDATMAMYHTIGNLFLVGVVIVALVILYVSAAYALEHPITETVNHPMTCYFTFCW
jgi:hypothetical protein